MQCFANWSTRVTMSMLQQLPPACRRPDISLQREHMSRIAQSSPYPRSTWQGAGEVSPAAHVPPHSGKLGEVALKQNAQTFCAQYHYSAPKPLHTRPVRRPDPFHIQWYVPGLSSGDAPANASHGALPCCKPRRSRQAWVECPPAGTGHWYTTPVQPLIQRPLELFNLPHAFQSDASLVICKGQGQGPP